MRRHRRAGRRLLLLGALLVPLLGTLAVGHGRPAAAAGSSRPFDGMLSLLTYNVKGLPWPAASGRGEKLRRIAADLLAMRRRGTNPDVVVLQEAFTGEAQAIGAEAGYRYVAAGPGSGAASDAAATAADRLFLAGARLRKGEREGKLLGSGLMILSDYPILAVRRTVWPGFACAGFDCLANKGAMLAVVAPPGAPSPVDIVTTHLNSLGSAGVPAARSLLAYRRQAGLLAAFVRTWHDPSRPLVVAGDFNMHESAARRAALTPAIFSFCGPRPACDALQEATVSGLKLSAEAESVLRLGRDRQYFAPGRQTAMEVAGASTLFGPDAAGAMLSDHVGYEATYRFAPADAPSPARRQAPGARSGG